MNKLTISIVSHGQADMIKKVLGDFMKLSIEPAAVIITHNLPEDAQIDPDAYSFKVKIIANRSPQGFGANHNAAFEAGSSEFFCVMNPDVRLDMNPFPLLMESVSSGHIGIAAPLVSNESGAVEDSARYFVTPGQLIGRIFRKRAGIIPELLRRDCPGLMHPDWIAGICMMFHTDTFRAVGGFDEGYRLYYEDVDICARMRIKGFEIALCPKARIIHYTQNERFRNIRHLHWHIASVARYFSSDVYRKVRSRRLFPDAGTNRPSDR